MLKIGFIVDNETTVPAHYAETIKAVAQSGHAVCFVVMRRKAITERKPLALRAFYWFEEPWFKSKLDADEAVSITQWIKAQNTIRFGAEGPTQEEANALKAEAFDLLYGLFFTANELETFSPLAAYGLWTIHIGSLHSFNKALPAFDEVMADAPVTESSLLVYRGGQTLTACEGSTRTVPYSVKNNLSSVLWKASSYLPYRLTTLEKEGESFFERRLIIKLNATERKFPGNLRVSYWIFRNLFRYLTYKRDSRKPGRFTVLYSEQKFALNDFVQQKFTPIKLPAKDAFYADPFVLEKDGINHVFFEEMNAAKGKAHISVVTINNGEVSKPQPVLQKSYHLSYPFVFLHEGDYYMMPETAENKTVELYKASSFPFHWEFVMNLMEGVSLLDATLHFQGDKWWLFAGGSHHPSASTNDQLFLFYSRDLFSTEWTPHPQNPIATHAGNCRPAGRIFRRNGKLYRPAQNNASQQYGYGLKLNEIEVLNEEEYKEKEVLSLLPETIGLKALHHLDFSSSLVVIDGIPK